MAQLIVLNLKKCSEALRAMFPWLAATLVYEHEPTIPPLPTTRCRAFRASVSEQVMDYACQMQFITTYPQWHCSFCTFITGHIEALGQDTNRPTQKRSFVSLNQS